MLLKKNLLAVVTTAIWHGWSLSLVFFLQGVKSNILAFGCDYLVTLCFRASLSLDKWFFTNSFHDYSIFIFIPLLDMFDVVVFGFDWKSESSLVLHITYLSGYIFWYCYVFSCDLLVHYMWFVLKYFEVWGGVFFCHIPGPFFFLSTATSGSIFPITSTEDYILILSI